MRRGLIALLALAAAGGVARAERPRAAILDIVSEGLPDDVREQFETLIEEGLRKVGYDVVDHAATFDAITKKDLAEGCTFGPCVSPIARAVNADKLLNARIGAVGQSYSFVISMLEARDGATVAQVVGTCPVCTLSEALTKVRASIDVLEGQRSATSPPALVERQTMRRRSRVPAALLMVAGVAAAAGGGALVAWTSHDAPGWVTIGSGGTVALTGLFLLVGD